MASPIDIFAIGARDGVYPGGQLAASREGQWLVNAAVGDVGPGLGPTHEEVIYDLASLTKPLGTTLLTARALDEGLCALEDPLCKWVPGVDPEVRLEHILEHSAGYPPHLRFDQALPKRLVPGSWHAWRHIVCEAASTKRERPVGKESVYTDIGFILLGAALEVMFARPLSQALSVLQSPLFYRDFRGPPALLPVRPRWPIAPTEDGICGQIHDENARAMGGVAGHAGLWGTAHGVLRVAEQLIKAYHGDRNGPLSPETVRRMWQPSLVPQSTRTLGWDRPSPVGSSTGGQWPDHAVGHLGFTGTSLWIEPDRAFVVVLVTNRVCPSRANNMIRRLRPALHDAAWTEWSKPSRPKPATPVAIIAKHSSPIFVAPRPAVPSVSLETELKSAAKKTRKPRSRTRGGVSAPPPHDVTQPIKMDEGDGPTRPSARAHPTRKPKSKR